MERSHEPSNPIGCTNSLIVVYVTLVGVTLTIWFAGTVVFILISVPFWTRCIPVFMILFSTTIYSAVNTSMLDRSFRPLLWVTALEAGELMQVVMKHRLRGLLWTYGVGLAVVFMVAPWSEFRRLAILPTAIFFGGLVYLLSIVLRLCSRRAVEAFVCALAVLFFVCWGVFLLDGLIWRLSGIWFFALTLGAVLGTKLWVQRAFLPGRVAVYLLAVYACFVAGLVHVPSWVLQTAWPGHEVVRPGFAEFSPFFWFAQHVPPDWSLLDAGTLLPAYWLALVLMLCWTWRWGIRSFDRMTGRPIQLQSRNESGMLVAGTKSVDISP